MPPHRALPAPAPRSLWRPLTRAGGRVGAPCAVPARGTEGRGTSAGTSRPPLSRLPSLPLPLLSRRVRPRCAARRLLDAEHDVPEGGGPQLGDDVLRLGHRPPALRRPPGPHVRGRASGADARRAGAAVRARSPFTPLPRFFPPHKSFAEFEAESRSHGWPSFRDEEVVWDDVRVLQDGAWGGERERALCATGARAPSLLAAAHSRARARAPPVLRRRVRVHRGDAPRPQPAGRVAAAGAGGGLRFPLPSRLSFAPPPTSQTARATGTAST